MPAWGTSASWSAISTSTADRATPARSAWTAGSSRPTSSTTCPTTAYSTRPATSVPGQDFCIVRFHGVDIAMTICEDMWQEGGPFAVAAAAGVDLVVNINGSPYERNKDDVRLRAGRPAGGGGGGGARLRQPGRRPGRTGVRRRLVRAGRRRRGAGAGPAVRVGACTWSTSGSRPGRRRRRPRARCDEPMTVRRARHRHGSRCRPTRRSSRPSPSASATRRRCGARSSWAPATTSARTASDRWSWASPGGSTRPWSPPSPPTRSAAATSTASRCPATTPPSIRSPTPRS